MKTDTKKATRKSWKWHPEDAGIVEMGSCAELATKYLLRLVRGFKARPDNAVMVSAVKVAHLAELAGMAVAMRARACAKLGADKHRFAEAQQLKINTEKGKGHA